MKTQRAKPQPEDVAIPASLDGDQFKSAWTDWLQHLREASKRPTSVYAKQALELLATLGPDDAVACLRKAIQLCRTYFDINDSYARTPATRKEAMSDSTDKLFGDR